MLRRFLKYFFGSFPFVAFMVLIYYSVIAPEPWTIKPGLDYKFLLYCILPVVPLALLHTIASAASVSKVAERVAAALVLAAGLYFVFWMVVFKSVFIDDNAVSANDFVLPVFLLVLAVSFFYAARWYVRKFQSMDFEND